MHNRSDHILVNKNSQIPKSLGIQHTKISWVHFRLVMDKAWAPRGRPNFDNDRQHVECFEWTELRNGLLHCFGRCSSIRRGYMPLFYMNGGVNRIQRIINWPFRTCNICWVHGLIVRQPFNPVGVYWNYSFLTFRLLHANKSQLKPKSPGKMRKRVQDLLFEFWRFVVLINGSLGGIRHTLLSELKSIPACRSEASTLARTMQKPVILDTKFGPSNCWPRCVKSSCWEMTVARYNHPFL